MKFPVLSIAIIISLFCSISCRDAISERRNFAPKKTEAPETDYKKREPFTPEDETTAPPKPAIQKEKRKKKPKAKDTLKPVTAIP